ncbi:hypothetical protein FPQ18DRAFT_322010 [Pyronema domesticum]|uniref:Similar to Cytochrome b2, mitochondrial acc. no. P00175 n=1 Tax=Pyronema omphalodes (strain CBS 100304) TaxID=1076935 RepID=U4LLP4_PYROM|nr:hypothetical protein FPQ18DRAFT_322010 [Pyronema domesticum]CCX32833.1 Similar to Cytochrome b2, mitochondrial; acc. no. P00175 [Pyronema omphalodes CBS 100304]
MYLTTLLLLLGASTVLAERPFVNEPDTGLRLDEIQTGTLPQLKDMHTIPDFEAAARHYMPIQNYSYYRTGSSGEFSYRAALEIFNEVKLRPRFLRDMSNISLSTSVFNYTFSVPFFIAPAARAGLAHPGAEVNFVRAAGVGKVLYSPSLSSTLKIEQIGSAALPEQVMFHQLYVSKNKTKLASDLKRIEKSGFKAIFVTIDNPIHGIRPREARYGFSNVTDHDSAFSWDSYQELRKMTHLPVIPKGVQTVEDALIALQLGAPGIYISNHGGRQLDTSPQAIETCLEIYQNAPEIFKRMEVFADGGVRYGTDVLKLLAMGVKMVGMARPFLFANVFGEEGIWRAIEMMRREVWVDAANLGVRDVREIDTSYLNMKRLERFVWEMK